MVIALSVTGKAIEANRLLTGEKHFLGQSESLQWNTDCYPCPFEYPPQDRIKAIQKVCEIQRNSVWFSTPTRHELLCLSCFGWQLSPKTCPGKGQSLFTSIAMLQGRGHWNACDCPEGGWCCSAFRRCCSARFLSLDAYTPVPGKKTTDQTTNSLQAETICQVLYSAEIF